MSSRYPTVAPLALALAYALAFAAMPALAADPAATADEEAARKSPELEKVQVVGARSTYIVDSTSTATRTDTQLQDVPQAITIVSSELIRDQAMQGMADVIRYVPGAGMAQGEGNRDTPILRGSSSTADLFVDGMRDDVQYFRDLYNIDRVEALKGPNAMIFGRGGSGGVLNRVSKQADWNEVRDFNLSFGSWSRGRAVADYGQAINDALAFRLTALKEDTGSYRDGVDYQRVGVNPTLAWRPGETTTLTFGLEHFSDERTADRGVPSAGDRPVDTDPSTFFGDPDRSRADVDVDAFSLLLEHDFANGLNVRNRTRIARYDKFYQNVFPGAVFGNDTVAIQAYNNATQRDNSFNQTDLTLHIGSGAWQHTLLGGFELGRQETDNYRSTGFFPANKCPSSSSGNTVTSTCVALANPRYEGAIDWAQSPSDGDNHSVARVAAAYLQDQVEFSPEWQAIFGVRFDRFEVDFHNNRNGQELTSTDNLVSPRVGVVWKPAPEASIYSSYSVAYLPRSGEQLSSLSSLNAALDPEKYDNIELGAKWQFTPGFNFTAAAYRLDRSNVAVVDPEDATRLVVLPGESQRVSGLEIGLSGDIGERWHLFGGYAWQKGELTRDIKTSATAAVLPKGTELALVPRHSFSLWNRVDLAERWGVGLGLVSRSRAYTSTSNAVVLPGYVRADAAVYFALAPKLGLQLNVENLFDLRYFGTANSDNNITPGSPRAFSVGLNVDL